MRILCLRLSYLFLLLLSTLYGQFLVAQSDEPLKISDFTSVDASQVLFKRPEILTLPTTHTFQKIIKNGEIFSDGSTYNIESDFTGYSPINGSSSKGYLTVNNNTTEAGGTVILDIEYANKSWGITDAIDLNFSSFSGTSRNSSGTITPWETAISSEDHDVKLSFNSAEKTSDGYFQYGWQIEIDPDNKQVLRKLYAMGNFSHAGICIHPNQQTVYQGGNEADGYLYKFIADKPGDLSMGSLYVYKADETSEATAGSIKTAGSGQWLRLNNTTVRERNSVRSQAKKMGATKFDRIKDIEIGPKGLVYFAVNGNESAIYFLEDISPIPEQADQTQKVNFKGVYAGESRTKYSITRTDGTTYYEQWRDGNDNLAFDSDGNLFVLQSGGKGHIWMIEKGHTLDKPKVKLFAITPNFAIPTGITFTPDDKFMFLSLKFKSDRNKEGQLDAKGKPVIFDDNMSIVIARKSDLLSSKNTVETPLPYCDAKGRNSGFEYIDQVSFAGINEKTGPNGGYADLKSASVGYASPGSTLPVQLTAGYKSIAYSEYWSIWMDINQDGDFLDQGEKLFSAFGFDTVSGEVKIPSDAKPGKTAIRIAMQLRAYAEPCGIFAYGEVEDYSIIIEENESKINPFDLLQKEDLTVSPNPATNYINITTADKVEQHTTGKTIQLYFYDTTGKIVQSHKQLANKEIRLNIENLVSNQLYIVQLISEDQVTRSTLFLKQ